MSGTEGGGHCGSVSTMVLVPEVKELSNPMEMFLSWAVVVFVLESKWQELWPMGADGVCVHQFFYQRLNQRLQ